MNFLIFGLICSFFVLRSQALNANEIFVKKNVELALSQVNFSILPPELVEKLTEAFENDENLYTDDISTIINEFADKLFANIQNYINKHNLNTMDIPDAHLSTEPIGYIDLSQGVLQDLNTIGRREDLVVTYSNDKKLLIVNLPIKFDDLKFYYHYHAKELFISITGDLNGSIKDIKINADLSFDFTTYKAYLDHYDMKDSGKVTLKFSGNGVIDWVINAASGVVTTFLGQTIVNVMAKFIRETLRKLVEDINEFIDKIINP